MKKDRAMKETKELLNLLVISAIVLLCFSKVATACPPPACPDCYTWDEETKQCEPDCSLGEDCCSGGSSRCCDDGECCYMDCCGGPCEVCDFVTGCEKNPLSKQEFKQFVFLYFSCP